MFSSLQSRSGGPYASTTASLGELPSITPDIPVSAVFIAIFIAFAATNMTILQVNLRRNHKFVLSGAMFGFSMARITTLVLRIVWASRQHNVRLAIAAGIFVNAGILVIYIVNFILSQRILRAKQPHVGWNPIYRVLCKVLYFGIFAALVMVIAAMVVSVYTLNPHTKTICRDIQLAALTYFLVFSCLPFLHVAVTFWLPRSQDEETFGEGSMGAKTIIVLLSTGLCVFNAGFKAGVNWSPLRPITSPGWFDSKASFYVFIFVFEVLILCLLTFSRIDKRFFVPNGCKGPGDYTQLREKSSKADGDDSGSQEA
ncbi:hypothetical protein P170DRAFT_437015 [Aspergillus steynii IBT 23096]|uniref:Uncharacterized protein n=1 Tax=Aspergillus steynii IBT 23096 TaxID=1392250 RepID=A0A2I2G988_9EURO|nr:uncharacterized protein P170DRAFT_437015 [Aspergillus steynii IBT 23096]PLB49442.1 hypothetical protein P170DRAFT_437015 [Aspergillus steynii IBT 23096]